MSYKKQIEEINRIDHQWMNRSIELGMRWLQGKTDFVALFSTIDKAPAGYGSTSALHCWVDIYSQLVKRGDIIPFEKLSKEDQDDLRTEVRKFFSVDLEKREGWLCKAMYAIIIIDEMNKKG